MNSLQKCIYWTLFIAALSLKGMSLSESGPIVSQRYKEAGVFEVKNYILDRYTLQVMDQNNKTITVSGKSSFTIPEAKGTKQEQLGYLRIDLGKEAIKQPLIFVMSHGGKEIGRFMVRAGKNRERILVSLEKDKDGKLTIRSQSGAFMGLSKNTTSGIPTDRNISNMDLTGSGIDIKTK